VGVVMTTTTDAVTGGFGQELHLGYGFDIRYL
jgi:hypothetical protein